MPKVDDHQGPPISLQARFNQAEAALTSSHSAVTTSSSYGSNTTTASKNTTPKTSELIQNDPTHSKPLITINVQIDKKLLTPQVGIGTLLGTAAGVYLGGIPLVLSAFVAFGSSFLLQDEIPKLMGECKKRRPKRD